MEDNLYYYNSSNYNKKEEVLFKIKRFYRTINDLVLNIKNISKTLNTQIICSEYLIKEILIEKNYSKKFSELYDRIRMLKDSRRLLDENIESINLNIKHFFKKFNKILILDNNKINNINIKEYNNNVQYKTLFNNNYFDTKYNDNNLRENLFYAYNDIKFDSINKKYIKTQKRNKKNNLSHEQKRELEINNIFNEDSNLIFNKNKKSRNSKINKNYNYNPSTNIENTYKTISAKKNYTNSNSNSLTISRMNRINGNYSINLAKNVIKFLNIIKEMKMKYNKKDSIYDLEFKRIKLIYDKLKIYIMNISKKVIDIYSNNKNKQINNIINIKTKEENKTNITNNKSNNLNKNIKINLLIEKSSNFCYINLNKIQKINIISNEISFNINSKTNHFIRDIYKIHETELIINGNIDTNKLKINELEEKIKILNEELSKYKSDIDIENIENKNEESKVYKDQIELLLNENQELKNQLEEYKENNNVSMSNTKEEMENYYKEINNENESKIKLLTEQKIFYENEIKKYKENSNKENLEVVNLKIENSIIQKEFEDVKKENYILSQKIKEYKIKNNFEEIIPDKFDIICDKNYEQLNWILIRKKEGKESDYENYLWIEKNLVNDLDKFDFLKEEDSFKQQIMNYITQLEEKEDIIFKLKQKLNKYEK